MTPLGRPFIALCVCSVVLLAAGLAGRVPQQDVRYVPRYRDPVITEMKEQSRRAQEARQAETAKVRETQRAVEKKAKDEAPELRCDFAGIEKPVSPEDCRPAFHFPPVRQFRTGNCWAHSTTSYFESEVARLSGRKIKLSEMYTVYFEYVEKARRYVQQRGASYFDAGSEGTVVPRVWARYGVVPAEAYRGTRDPDGRFDDNDMLDELKAYLEQVRQHELWNEELVVASLRLILDKHMGRPPERFTFEGAELTPAAFLADVLKLKFEDYASVMSTLATPVHEYGEYKVQANWWHEAYYNMPLEEFYGVLRYAAQHGYTVRLNGDTSEPGYDGCEGVAIVPSFDVPREYIDASARELRIFNKTTDDDHDIHLVGTTHVGDYDWFLIKDSSNEAQCGAAKGYFFYREDYVKLKMLTYTVHRDVVEAVIKGFKPRGT